MSAKQISVTVAAVFLACVGLFILWLFEGTITSKAEMRSGLGAIERFDQEKGVNNERGFSVNTYTHEISSLSIEGYYDSAARALKKKGGEQTVTYRWQDMMGWPRVSTVLDVGNGYVEVLAAQNNDNDSVSILFKKGRFSRDNTKVLPSISLPKGTLRSN